MAKPHTHTCTVGNDSYCSVFYIIHTDCLICVRIQASFRRCALPSVAQTQPNKHTVYIPTSELIEAVHSSATRTCTSAMMLDTENAN